MTKLAIAFAALLLLGSMASAADKYSVAQIKVMLSKKAANSYAQGCSNGQTWCCKKTFSGSTSCSCTSFCS